jgi:hypothetical protein
LLILLVDLYLQFLSLAIPQLISPPMVTSLDLALLISNNPTLAYPLFISLLVQFSSKLNLQRLSAYLDALKYMPPTLSSFDLLGRLLRDPTEIADFTSGGRTTGADLVSSEREEREGLLSDGRLGKGVQNVGIPNVSVLHLS